MVSNIKRPLLERIARCSGAPITPSVDKISTTRLGQCEQFRLEKFSEQHEPANQFTKKPSKTLMFFDGCPRRLGCTVLLKGSYKHVVQYAIFAAYHLSLETSFLADEGSSLPKITTKPSVAAPERLYADNAVSPISEVTSSPKSAEHDVAVDTQNSHLMKEKSVVTHSDLSEVSLECPGPDVEEIISRESTDLEKGEVTDGTNEYYSATDNNQSILYPRASSLTFFDLSFS
ncbi:putative 1-phosphatidylinositol-3-phosphate 5-kinase FAB1C [Tanacetum coccineum]